MMHGNVVQGVMSLPEMDAMMYKIEGEDLYLIGTSEHSMIGKFIDQIIPEESLPRPSPPTPPASARRRAPTALRSAASTASTSRETGDDRGLQARGLHEVV